MVSIKYWLIFCLLLGSFALEICVAFSIFNVIVCIYSEIQVYLTASLSTKKTVKEMSTFFKCRSQMRGLMLLQ